MKNKIIILFALVVFFAPTVSDAGIIIPDANLNIVVNTQGREAPFNFSLKAGYYEYDEELDDYILVWHDYQNFNLQTQNLTASVATAVSAWGGQYLLSQENTEGFEIDIIHCASESQSDNFSYLPDGVIMEVNSTVAENIICVFNNTQINEKIPVLIVPGLLGTEMKNGDELLWADLVRMATDVGDSFIDPLEFNENLTPINNEIYKNNIIKKQPFLDYADGLINEFKNQGYVENDNLFTFPYDWRYGASGKYADNKTNSDLLGEKINVILQQTGGDKVDVVAHSLGGLIVKKYVMDNPASHHIGKAVFVGVPNTGAPKSVKVLLQGDSFGIPWLAESEIKKISENMPASYDLLPSQQYYDVNGSFIKTIDEAIPTTENPNVQNVIKDLNYQEVEGFLTEDHNLNSVGFDNAQILHTENFDNYDLRTAGVELYAIDGCKAGTLGKVIERRRVDFLGNNITEYDAPKFTPGDGTVPLESATNLPISQENKFYSLSGSHSKMLSANGSRQKIVNLISGSSLEISNNVITQDINRCNLNGKAISVFSPIDIFVTDQFGNRLGLAEDRSVINEIPNADFEIWGEHKFVYLPDDDGQVYDISLQGIGTGTYTIKSQDIVAGQAVTTEVFSNLAATTQLTGKMNLNADPLTGSGQVVLLIKQTSESEIETVLPSATLIGEDLEDLLPPTATATLTGEKNKDGLYVNFAFVKINANDTESGVLDIEYSLDEASIKKVPGGMAEINVEGEGRHVITFFASDMAGNNSPKQTINFEIINLPTSKDQCKKDGWKNFGGKFKNQGECVSFVESKKPKK